MPRPSISHIANQLASARRAKQISQQALGRKIGVPQSHISKIERGMVDVGLSTLIQMSRVLDMEIMLVARPLVPAVQGMQHADKTRRVPEAQRPAYPLDDEEDEP